jgi:hypothetical protein
MVSHLSYHRRHPRAYRARPRGRLPCRTSVGVHGSPLAPEDEVWRVVGQFAAGGTGSSASQTRHEGASDGRRTRLGELYRRRGERIRTSRQV